MHRRLDPPGEYSAVEAGTDPYGGYNGYKGYAGYGGFNP